MTEDQKLENETRWTVDAEGVLPPQYVDDTARRYETGFQLYEGNHCRFSSGLVFNPDHPPDVIYLIIERGHPDDGNYDRVEKHLRPDEAIAIAHLLTGACWSWSHQRIIDGKDAE